jgi:hypothetical protein
MILTQLQTIGWLRWRLTRNQWGTSRGLGALLSGMLLVASLLTAAGTFSGGLAAGVMVGASDAGAEGVMAAWLVVTFSFLLFWSIGLLTDLQRDESIDLPRLMHLPVALGPLFVVNYLASHLTLSLIVIVPAMVGLAVGLTVSLGPRMLLTLPLALSVVLMVTAWTYWLRGWLVTLIDTPSRRRLAVSLLTVGLFALIQGPNLYFNLLRERPDRTQAAPLSDEAREAARNAAEARQQVLVRRLRLAETVVPVLWVSGGARTLAEGRMREALAGTLFASLLALVGLQRAYRRTLRFYRGEVGGRAAARAPASSQATPARPSQRRASFVHVRFPGIPDPAAAVALATLQSHLRAPEILMQWVTSALVTVAVGGSFLLRRSVTGAEWAAPFAATGAVAGAVFLSVPFFGNQFGFARGGFRAFVLAPIERRHTLLGHNLAAIVPAAATGLVLVAGVAVWMRLPVVVLVATLLQLVACLVLMALAGSAVSILVPYRLQAGTVKPSKMPALSMITLVLFQLGMPLALSPVFGPAIAGYFWEQAGGPPAGLVNLLLSVLLALGALGLYVRLLPVMGRWLHRRETDMLRVLSTRVE